MAVGSPFLLNAASLSQELGQEGREKAAGGAGVRRQRGPGQAQV